jgi:hypothetical protein
MSKKNSEGLPACRRFTCNRCLQHSFPFNDTQVSSQKCCAASLAADLATGRPRNLPSLDQHDRMRPQLVLFCQRLTNAADRRYRMPLTTFCRPLPLICPSLTNHLAMTPYFGHDD